MKRLAYIFASVTTALAFTMLFFEKNIGLNLVILEWITIPIMIFLNRPFKFNKLTITALFILLTTSLAVLYSHTNWTIFVNILMFFTCNSIIAFKEYRRLTGSSVYMTNAAVGEVLTVLLGILTLIFGFERIILTVTMDAPIDIKILQPAIPFVIYFFIGMVATTACSFSLEGKNYWILQSLPVTKKDICQGKMLFNLYLTIPFMTFGILCLCISARVPLINTVLYVILGTALCAFSTAWGSVCGIRFMRLDWENEIEVIKQGTAITLYLLPNMFACMILTVLMVILGIRIDHRMLTAIMILIVTFLAWLSYRRALSLAKNL